MEGVKSTVTRNRYVYTLRFTYSEVAANKSDSETNSVVERIAQKGGKVINYTHLTMGGAMATPIYLLTFIHYEAEGPIIL